MIWNGRSVDVKPLDCAGCTLCCQGDLVPLTKSDDPDLYETQEIGGQAFLAHRDGSCVYLNGGCTIHDRKPFLCRQYDCRKYLTMDEDQRGVWLQGNEKRPRIWQRALAHAL